MTAALDPRRTLRETSISLDTLLPHARAGATMQREVTQDLAHARSMVDASRRLNELPWTPVLDVSNRHLTSTERDLLAAGVAPDPFTLSMTNGYAWLLLVQLPRAGYPEPAALGEGLSRIYRLALQHGFSYVRIDEDAPPIATLEQYP
jgi:hypothetical protein